MNRSMVRAASAWLGSVLLLVGCRSAVAPSKKLTEIKMFQGAPALPQGPISGHPWATQACGPAAKPDPGILACVQGVAITRARFDAVRSAYPPATPPRDILQALIDEEVLAAAAAATGGWSAELTQLQRRASVAKLLENTQEKAISADTISATDIAQAYKDQRIRLHYDHNAAYFVTDVQLLCCKGDHRQCEKREEVRACIDRTEVQARALWQALRDDSPATPEELKAKVAALGDKFPLAAVADVEFWYDKAKTYEAQKGYDLMVKEFALPVVEMQPGDISQPIRSPFGWHIARLLRVEPAMHKTDKDPEVRRDIADHIVGPVREREAQHYAVQLFKKYEVQFFYDRLGGG